MVLLVTDCPSPLDFTVILVDDHPIVSTALQGIALTIPNLKFIGSAKNCAEATELITQTQPHLAILDMSLPDGDGIDLIIACRKLAPNTRLLAFSMNQEKALGHRALSAGASGYLMKGSPIPLIREAIETVLRGETFMSPELARRLACSSLQKDNSTDSVTSLTTREFQVFRYLGEGLTTREIAKLLKISIKTVETHRENIKNKLTCENSSQLILAARDWVRENIQSDQTTLGS